MRHLVAYASIAVSIAVFVEIGTIAITAVVIAIVTTVTTKLGLQSGYCPIQRNLVDLIVKQQTKDCSSTESAVTIVKHSAFQVELEHLLIKHLLQVAFVIEVISQ